MELTPIFIIGFIVLGIYKLVELFVKKKERLTLIEKLPIFLNQNQEEKNIHLPQISLGIGSNYGSWALRISLLLIGIGLGFILSLIIQINCFDTLKEMKTSLGYRYDNLILLINFACITFLGGVGLFVAYIIESVKEKKNNKQEIC